MAKQQQLPGGEVTSSQRETHTRAGDFGGQPSASAQAATMSQAPADAAERIQSLQEVTGGKSEEECAQVLEAHGWDLNEAVSFMLAMGEEDAEPRGAWGPAQAQDHTGTVDTASFPSAPPLNGSGQLGAGLFGANATSLRSRGGSSLAMDRRLDAQDGGAELRGGLASSAAGAGSPFNPSGDLPSGGEGMGGLGRGGVSAAGPGQRRHAPGSASAGAGGSRGGGVGSLLRRVVSFPLWLVRGGLGALAGAVALSVWAAGGAFSFFLARLASLAFWATGGALGAPLGRGRPGMPRHTRAVTLPEAALFRQRFEAEYGTLHPEFFPGTFQEALRRSSEQFRFLLVYLHSAGHSDTPRFCQGTLCNPAFVQYVDNTFVMWGGDVRGSEGFLMSGRLRAASFPFLAVLTSAGSQRTHLLRSIEGPLAPAELMGILQRVVEEQGAMLVAARADEEERLLNRRLREEQDTAYQAALLEDQEKERKQEEEEQRRKEEAAAAERLREEEAARQDAAARAAEEVQAAMERRRREAAEALGTQPEKGPQVTQVVIRLPGGERKDRRFESSSPVQSLFNFVDSEALGTPSIPSMHYSLVSNFPRTVHSRSQGARTLLEAGLHPQASLFVQMEEAGVDEAGGDQGPGKEGGLGLGTNGAEKEVRDPEAWAAKTGKKEIRD